MRWAVFPVAALAALAACSRPEPAPSIAHEPPAADASGRVVLSDAEWRARLSPLAFAVLRRGSTELAYTGRYHKHAARGIYRCAGCALPLFSSGAKYDSRTGWPSFRAPLPGGVETHAHGSRDEVKCRRCGGHLGHVFPDGPPPDGLRYCVNSAALAFDARSAPPD